MFGITLTRLRHESIHLWAFASAVILFIRARQHSACVCRLLAQLVFCLSLFYSFHISCFTSPRNGNCTRRKLKSEIFCAMCGHSLAYWVNNALQSHSRCCTSRWDLKPTSVDTVFFFYAFDTLFRWKFDFTRANDSTRECWGKNPSIFQRIAVQRCWDQSEMEFNLFCANFFLRDLVVQMTRWNFTAPAAAWNCQWHWRWRWELVKFDFMMTTERVSSSPMTQILQWIIFPYVSSSVFTVRSLCKKMPTSHSLIDTKSNRRESICKLKFPSYCVWNVSENPSTLSNMFS